MGSKLEKGYKKAAQCHPAYVTRQAGCMYVCTKLDESQTGIKIVRGKY